MKKFVTLMMMCVMLFSFSITASAAKSPGGKPTTDDNGTLNGDGSGSENPDDSGSSGSQNGVGTNGSGAGADGSGSSGSQNGAAGSAGQGVVSPKTGESDVVLYSLGLTAVICASGAVVLRRKTA